MNSPLSSIYGLFTICCFFFGFAGLSYARSSLFNLFDNRQYKEYTSKIDSYEIRRTLSLWLLRLSLLLGALFVLFSNVFVELLTVLLIAFSLVILRPLYIQRRQIQNLKTTYEQTLDWSKACIFLTTSYVCFLLSGLFYFMRW